MKSGPDTYNYYVPTLREDIPLILKGLERGMRYCDLGSGDGRLLLAAAAIGAEVTGIELDTELIAKTRYLCSDRITIIEADYFKVDWSGFDFLTVNSDTPLDPPIIEKFDRECRRGAILDIYNRARYVHE